MLAHHEHWSGGGYPKGLVKEEIPLESRIIAIADGYDVMTSTQSYHMPLTPEQARIELTNSAGNQYDPELVRVFVENVLNR